MMMRAKPIRGKQVKYFPTGEIVLLLDVVKKDFVSAIFPSGKISAVAKSSLDLPVIDTRAYEKIA